MDDHAEGQELPGQPELNNEDNPTIAFMGCASPGSYSSSGDRFTALNDPVTMWGVYEDRQRRVISTRTAVLT